MCNHCIKEEAKLRDTPLDENELAKLARLRKMDPAKYPGMMPAWIKTHNRNVAAPKPFEFKARQAPVYPTWVTACGKPDLTAAANARKYPTCTESTTVAKYVESFNRLNNLVEV